MDLPAVVFTNTWRRSPPRSSTATSTSKSSPPGASTENPAKSSWPLGTADTLFARLQQKQGEPIKARVQPFGFLAAAWGLAQKLQLVSLIDRHVPKRQQGASVGQYLVLAALNRLTSPNSKARMAQWYRKTPLQRWLPLSAKQLRSQRFWDAMNAVDESAIRKIEMQLSRQLVEDFGIDVRCLCFDCTNFDTFIDSRTTSELARRGHAKSKRTDLRVVGLALLVSTDFNIPLFSRVYPGNQPDSAPSEASPRNSSSATACWPRISSTSLWFSTRATILRRIWRPWVPLPTTWSAR